MPLFEYKCPNRRCVHGRRHVEVLKRDGTEPEFCTHCGHQMDMQWSSPAIAAPGRYGKGHGGVSQPLPRDPQ